MARNDLPSPVSDEEWEIRCELAAAYRLFHKFGWDEVIYGHLTCRVPNGSDEGDVENAHFLINPLGLRYDEITASALVTIDIHGNYINRGSTGMDINQAGYVIHSCIHESRHDMKCVMHCHTIEGSAVSAMKFGLLPISQLSHVAISAGVSYHDYEGLAVSEDEKPRLKADLGPDNKVYMLRNHGLLTGGHSIAEAFFWMYYTVHACKIQVAALSAGIENISYASEEVSKNFTIGMKPFVKAGVGTEMFNALRRGLPNDYAS
jgi:ribulose-5-phosphate 4-epimerase/fuculose-1-phosphate aldolase